MGASVGLEFGAILMVEKKLKINSLNEEKAFQAFLQTCASKEFAKKMVEGRPYLDINSLKIKAKEVFNSLSKEDWLEAFFGHPQIGDMNSLKKEFDQTKELAKGEQKSIEMASGEVLNDLTLYNKKYFTKFGYIFIVCATGKSAKEMLLMLKKRIDNNKEEEVYIAAEEQLEIMLLRMENTEWAK